MSKKVLFSPVGGTDPMKYFKDGSLLHICRVYKPDAVYLYMSKEICEHHYEDNRYVIALKRLGEFLEHPFEIHTIERPELTEVQLYDFFYREFMREIAEIEKEMVPEDVLILNMASGTPAMKSALTVIATLTEYRYLPVQVMTPQKKMNAEYEERESYDVETCWQLNEDNEVGFENRCREVQCMHLMRLLKIEAIKKHLSAYDYSAALSVAKEIRTEISTSAYELLEIAYHRSRLAKKEVATISKGQYDIYPVKEGNKVVLFEYALILMLKAKRREYADFIRAITPLVMDILELILRNRCQIEIRDFYCVKEGKACTWDETKLAGSEVEKVLNTAFNSGFRYGVVYSEHLKYLILYFCKDTVLATRVEELVAIEKQVRNVAAHEIVSVTEQWILKRTGKNIGEIVTLLKYLMGMAGVKVSEQDWNSYEQLNERIRSVLDEVI